MSRSAWPPCLFAVVSSHGVRILRTDEPSVACACAAVQRGAARVLVDGCSEKGRPLVESAFACAGLWRSVHQGPLRSQKSTAAIHGSFAP